MIRVLLVEDNPDDAYVLDLALAEAGTPSFRLARAERVEEAARLLSGEKTDVILTDLHLPDARGLETVEKLAAAARGIPIIVLSGSEDRSLETRLLAAGACACWSKDRLMDPALPAEIRRVAGA